MSDEAEREFDELAAWTGAELTRVRGDRAAEDGVLDLAVRRYVETRRKVDPEEPWSYATHFFGADGIAFERARTPAFRRVEGAAPVELTRWSEFIGALAMKLESDALG